MGRTLLALALSTLLAVPAAAQEAAIVSPVGPWQATNEGGLCRAERRFEAGGQPHLVILEQTAPGSRFGLAVAGSALAGLDPALPISLGFFDAAPLFERRARIEPNQLFAKVAVVRNLSFFPPAGEPVARIDAAVLADMDRISVTQGDTRATFATGPLGEAAMMLNACTAQILRSWDLDPAVQNGLRSGAEPEEQAKLARQLRKAYPESAYRSLQSGPLEAVALVDSTGAATACKVIVASGFGDLDAAACKAMARARYLPARDPAGNPVASFWTTRITFALSETDPVATRP